VNTRLKVSADSPCPGCGCVGRCAVAHDELSTQAEFFTRRNLAARLGASKSTIESLVESGLLRTTRMPGVKIDLIPAEDVAALINQMMADAGPKKIKPKVSIRAVPDRQGA